MNPLKNDEEQCGLVSTELANEIKEERSKIFLHLVLMETLKIRDGFQSPCCDEGLGRFQQHYRKLGME